MKMKKHAPDRAQGKAASAVSTSVSRHGMPNNANRTLRLMPGRAMLCKEKASCKDAIIAQHLLSSFMLSLHVVSVYSSITSFAFRCCFLIFVSFFSLSSLFCCHGFLSVHLLCHSNDCACHASAGISRGLGISVTAQTQVIRIGVQNEGTSNN